MVTLKIYSYTLSLACRLPVSRTFDSNKFGLLLTTDVIWVLLMSSHTGCRKSLVHILQYFRKCKSTIKCSFMMRINSQLPGINMWIDGHILFALENKRKLLMCKSRRSANKINMLPVSFDACISLYNSEKNVYLNSQLKLHFYPFHFYYQQFSTDFTSVDVHVFFLPRRALRSVREALRGTVWHRRPRSYDSRLICQCLLFHQGTDLFVTIQCHHCTAA